MSDVLVYIVFTTPPTPPSPPPTPPPPPPPHPTKRRKVMSYVDLLQICSSFHTCYIFYIQLNCRHYNSHCTEQTNTVRWGSLKLVSSDKCFRSPWLHTLSLARYTLRNDDGSQTRHRYQGSQPDFLVTTLSVHISWHNTLGI